ncbi:MAG: lycopene cyclase domain-containing protein [Microbacteriaceae bacterium]|nr:lycopene cyclase domain-containing protein [Microbacteriaceae bacterium]
MTFVYISALLISLAGMILLDRRFALSFWHDARRAGIAMGISIAFLLAWDIAGVANGIFFRGESSWMIGIVIAPEVPIEEVFFLALLSYVTLNVFGFWRSRAQKQAPGFDQGDA